MCDSDYNIGWKGISTIVENIELMETVLTKGKPYSRIRFAVLGNDVVGFGVWG